MKKLGKSSVLKIVLIAAAVTVLAVLVFVMADSRTEKSADNTFTPDEISLAVIETVTTETEGTETTILTETTDSTESPEKTLSLIWTQDSDSDSWTAVKTVSVRNVDEQNVNNADAYIRVTLIPKWTAQVIITETPATETAAVETAVPVDIVSGNYGLTSFGKLTDISVDITSGSQILNSFTMGDVTFILAEGWDTYWIFNSSDGYFYYRESVEPGSETKPLLAKVQISDDTHTTIENYDIQLQIDVLTDGIQTQGGALDARWSSSGIEIIDGELGTAEPTENQ